MPNETDSDAPSPPNPDSDAPSPEKYVPFLAPFQHQPTNDFNNTATTGGTAKSSQKSPTDHTHSSGAHNSSPSAPSKGYQYHIKKEVEWGLGVHKVQLQDQCNRHLDSAKESLKEAVSLASLLNVCREEYESKIDTMKKQAVEEALWEDNNIIEAHEKALRESQEAFWDYLEAAEKEGRRQNGLLSAEEEEELITKQPKRFKFDRNDPNYKAGVAVGLAIARAKSFLPDPIPDGPCDLNYLPPAKCTRFRKSTKANKCFPKSWPQSPDPDHAEHFQRQMDQNPELTSRSILTKSIVEVAI